MKITWFGHSAFRVEFGDTTILLDPFITGNPSVPEGVTPSSYAAGASHLILSHGHDDHLGDSLDILKETGATLTANWEICMYAASRGHQAINPMNSGGTVDLGAFSVALTTAHHSSASTATMPPLYLGNPHGVVIKAEGEPTLYFAGDTDIFSDMALIREFHAPDIAILPIGDRFTMDGKMAAIAAERFLKPRHVIPCHYGTFPLLDPNPDKLIAGLAGSGIIVHTPKPGESVVI